jgi:hypothetical protein
MKRSPRGPACLERDLATVLPHLPPRFGAGEVGRLLMRQGRGYNERVGVLARLERHGYIRLLLQDTRGQRTRLFQRTPRTRPCPDTAHP